MLRLVIFSFLVTAAAAAALNFSRRHVFNQDGLGFSGGWDRCEAKERTANGGTPQVTLVNTWPAGFPRVSTAFAGGVFDSTHVWMVPYSASGVVRVDVSTLNVTVLKSWPAGLVLGTGAFRGAVFDSTHVWLVPCSANAVVRIDVTTLNMTLIKAWPAGLARGSDSFAGGIFASNHVWLVPFQANDVVRINAATLAMSMLNAWPKGLSLGVHAFYGGVFDSTNIWLVPFTATAVVRINPATLVTTLVPITLAGFVPSSYAFRGGVFDSTRVWLIPSGANGVVLIDVQAFNMTLLNKWPAGLVRGTLAFIGGAFDSAHVWLVPYSANGVVRIDVLSLSMMLIQAWPAGFVPATLAFAGGVFDSTQIWLVPHNANAAVRIQTNVTCSGKPRSVSPTVDRATRSVTPAASTTPLASRFILSNSVSSRTTSVSRSAVFTTQRKLVNAVTASALRTWTALERTTSPQLQNPTIPTPAPTPHFTSGGEQNSGPIHDDTTPLQTALGGDTATSVLVLVVGSGSAAVAGTISPTSANKPTVTSRVLTAATCAQLSDGGQAFPSSNAWALFPSMIPIAAEGSRAANTAAVASLILVLNVFVLIWTQRSVLPSLSQIS